MGKSAKFYKRPTKKEKEVNTVKKLVEPSAISKKSSTTIEKKISVPASIFQDKSALAAKRKTPKEEEEDVSMDIVEESAKPKESKKTEKEGEVPDYVDLFSGKKTYKKIPKKRK